MKWSFSKVTNQERTKKDRELTERKEKLREKLIGPEGEKEGLKIKLDAAEELLVINENEYAERRREYPSLNDVWYSSKTLITTIAVFVVTFLSTEFMLSVVSNKNTFFFTKLEFSLPAALGAALVPIIVSIAINNVRLQRKNAEINAIYSEISNLRSKITLLQQKMLDKDLKDYS